MSGASCRPDPWPAFDDRGRLYLSAENPEGPLLRVTFDNRGEVGRIEPSPAPIGQAMGLLHAHGSFYVNGRGPEGLGLYRLTDADGNDQLDPGEVRLLKRFSVDGEHGYHALALGPDGWIYVLNGSMTRPPEDLAPTTPFRHAGEDVLSLNPDEMGDVSGIKPPAGCSPSTATTNGTGARPGMSPPGSCTAFPVPTSAGGTASASARTTTPTRCGR